MIDRISQFIENQGISVSAFEQKITASDGMIRRAIKNKTDIQSKWLALISENYPNLNMDWLITGKGDMLKNKGSSAIIGNNNVKNTGTITGNVHSNNYNNAQQPQESLVEKEITSNTIIEDLKKTIRDKDMLLQAKDEIIKAKEDIIDLLKMQLKK